MLARCLIAFGLAASLGACATTAHSYRGDPYSAGSFAWGGFGYDRYGCGKPYGYFGYDRHHCDRFGRYGLDPFFFPASIGWSGPDGYCPVQYRYCLSWWDVAFGDPYWRLRYFFRGGGFWGGDWPYRGGFPGWWVDRHPPVRDDGGREGSDAGDDRPPADDDAPAPDGTMVPMPRSPRPWQDRDERPARADQPSRPRREDSPPAPRLPATEPGRTPGRSEPGSQRPEEHKDRREPRRRPPSGDGSGSG